PTPLLAPPLPTLFPYTTLFRSSGQLRAHHRLRGRQGAALRLREVPRRRAASRNEDAVDRRGNGYRAELRRGAAEGHPFARVGPEDRKSTRLNSSHVKISYAVFC